MRSVPVHVAIGYIGKVSAERNVSTYIGVRCVYSSIQDRDIDGR
jgi:hypothetical protein